MKTSVNRGMRLPVLLACASVVAGCATEQAAVEDRSIDETSLARSAAPTRSAEGTYRVVRGDTLYAIAFTRGLDYRDVASWNGIAPPYTILVGQELRLSAPNGARASAAVAPASASAVAAASRPSAPAPAKVASAPPPARSDSMFEDVPSQFAPPASAQSDPVRPAASAARAVAVEAGSESTPPSANAAMQKSAPAVAAQSPTGAPASPPAPAPPPVVVAPPPPVERSVELPTKPVSEGAVANAGGIAWRWPNTGKLLGGFVAGDQTRQGVDIAGSAGDPVRAAADGEVVYSGNGLIGYGELIIVKHNASFLSAYGHNRKRLVQEGEKVRAGQQIAEMGSSASSRDELHFEIRKNGKPVNPMDYLPGR